LVTGKENTAALFILKAIVMVTAGLLTVANNIACFIPDVIV